MNESGIDDSDIDTLFELMSVDRPTRANSRGDRYVHCPLHPDKRPSASVRLWGFTGVYKCFSCRQESSIYDLAKEYGRLTNDYTPLDFVKQFIHKSRGDYSKYKDENYYGKELARAVMKKVKYESKFQEIKITEDKLLPLLDRIPNYAFERGLTKKQILDWEIGLDPKQNRMIFTIRDYLGTLVGVSGRALDPQAEPKYKHYPGFSREKYLYGERFLDRMNPRCYIVEGFLDVLAMQRQGISNVFAVMGSSLSDIQIEKIKRWFSEVIFLPDGDLPGLQFCESYGLRLKQKGLRVGIAGVQESPSYLPRSGKSGKWIPSDFEFVLRDFVLGKDPDELSSEEVSQLLSDIQWLELK